MAGSKPQFQQEVQETDVCVVGGGMAGVCAALAAARHGAKVILVQDRPVLGGNSSSECRMHVCGADRHNGVKHMRETGLLEELRLENLHRNPFQRASLWDFVLYDALRQEPNASLIMNCSINAAQTDGQAIKSITGWQLTTETYQTVKAKYFIDCSGDGILAPLTGAEFRLGREARAEFGESIAPEQADGCTMGHTCLFFAEKYDRPQTFVPPAWAYSFPREEDLPYGPGGHKHIAAGYWWVELGGQMDRIRDTEKIRDELMRIVMGVWDHIKNHGDHGAENWALSWLQFLPAKRESRRYVGDHILTQPDIEARGAFPDMVAYGGWSMDDHHPSGFWSAKLGVPSTIFHHAPSPYGIPYRMLYSRNIDNLFMAGRNVSATHAAFSSLRVMGTCAIMGQAAGTAAALANAHSLTPRQVGGRIGELQELLLRDDVYLPGYAYPVSTLTKQAKLTASRGDAEPVRDGVHRQIDTDPHCWLGRPGESLTYEFSGAKPVREAVLFLDSAMDQNIAMEPYYSREPKETPAVTPSELILEVRKNGQWRPAREISGNYQRFHRVSLAESGQVEGVRLTLKATHGAPESRVYGFLVE